MVSIASSPEQLTADWLTSALRESDQLPTGNVTGVEHKIIGTGKMGDNARLTLTYDGDYNAPTTLIAKLPATDETARGMAGALGAYHNEVMFYRHLAEQTAIATPKIYANEVNDEGTDFVILMEDLYRFKAGYHIYLLLLLAGMSEHNFGRRIFSSFY